MACFRTPSSDDAGLAPRAGGVARRGAHGLRCCSTTARRNALVVGDGRSGGVVVREAEGGQAHHALARAVISATTA